jgi:hypothetical protein
MDHDTGTRLYHGAMDGLTFDQFADFIRELWRVSTRKQIAPETQFERDLGLTGDDGDELLRAIVWRQLLFPVNDNHNSR